MSGQKHIVEEAQRLRDYLMHKGGVDQANLIDALRPFEDSSQTAPDDYSFLFIAFQATKEKSLGIVDDLTLSEVLKGKSPYQERSNVMASAGVTLVGVMLVILAVYFTNWSQRATYLLAEADRFATFDHFGRMTRLIELAEMIDNDEPPEPEEFPSIETYRNLTPEEVVILESVYELSRHYAREHGLFANMAQHIGRVNPALEFPASLRRRFCPAAVYSETARAPPTLSRWQELLGCIPPRPATPQGTRDEGNGQTDSNEANGRAASASAPAFQAITRYQGMQRTAMQYAERKQLTDYSITLQQVRTWTDALEGSLAMVSRLFLPIIYGALGSIVYCMWRLLNPATSPLGFWYTILRTAFAGLAALTLSALIVPSNVLAVGAEVTRPFVYMLSFIFGYSIEAFVNTLNALNRVLVSNIGPREKK